MKRPIQIIVVTIIVTGIFLLLNPTSNLVKASSCSGQFSLHGSPGATISAFSPSGSCALAGSRTQNHGIVASSFSDPGLNTATCSSSSSSSSGSSFGFDDGETSSDRSCSASSHSP